MLLPVHFACLYFPDLTLQPAEKDSCQLYGFIGKDEDCNTSRIILRFPPFSFLNEYYVFASPKSRKFVNINLLTTFALHGKISLPHVRKELGLACCLMR